MLPEKLESFDRESVKWFPTLDDSFHSMVTTPDGKTHPLSKRQHARRTPLLFKEEWSGHKAVFVNSKVYYGLSHTDKEHLGCKGAQNNRLKARYDETFKRMWEYYLLSCAGIFRARRLQLMHTVVTRPGREQPDCRVL